MWILLFFCFLVDIVNKINNKKCDEKDEDNGNSCEYINIIMKRNDFVFNLFFKVFWLVYMYIVGV